ncbi:MAG TPA: hypothetical protein VF189_05370 [Patescibacteria group bacterium]
MDNTELMPQSTDKESNTIHQREQGAVGKLLRFLSMKKTHPHAVSVGPTTDLPKDQQAVRAKEQNSKAGPSVAEIQARTTALETNSGIAEYATTLGKSPLQLQELMANKTVMDLGSGTGRFAAEVALRAIRHPNEPTPKHIDSVNIMYRASDYEMQTLPLKLPGETPTQAEIQQAWMLARENFKSWDWHKLSEAPNGAYDVILSSLAFPLYSDFKYTKPESSGEYEKMQKKGSFIKFGRESKHVFRELSRVLNVGGAMLLNTGFPLSAWEQSPRTQKEVNDFFTKLGCSIQMSSSHPDSNNPVLLGSVACMQITKLPHK